MKQSISVFVVVILTNSSCLSQDIKPHLYIEEIKLNSLPLVKGVDTIQDTNYYNYITKSDFTQFFGEPDHMQIRISEMYETEIAKLTYGSSHIEFYDPSFGEGISEDQYKLLSIELNDSSLKMIYRDKEITVGKELPSFYSLNKDDEKVFLELRRGKLDQISDYACILHFDGTILRKVVAYFD